MAIHATLFDIDAPDFIEAAISADDVDATMPTAGIFAAALNNMAPLATGNVVVVGDMPREVEPAGKRGITVIGLRSGNLPDEALCEASAVALYDGQAALVATSDQPPLGR